MKKIITAILVIFFMAPCADAFPCLFAHKTKAEKAQAQAVSEIKNVFKNYVEYENTKNLDGLKNIHSDEYITVDALPKTIYIDIINKTWKKYTDIKHDLKIKNIEVNGEYATAEVEETIKGSTSETIDNKIVKGELKSISTVIYYLHKHQNKWKFLSDYVVDEQTFLIFEDAKNLEVMFYAPNRILADKEYVATLSVDSIPRNSFVIATIGQEKIIYPHKSAPEVYRKIPNNGILERVFKSNSDNLNEYVVATYCLTKPRISETNEIETLLTGVGYVINRVNVVPENKFITVSDDGEKEKK